MSDIQGVFQVTRKQYMTPHYIRVYLTGDQLRRVINTTIGVNNKILIPPRGSREVHFPEFDPKTRRWVLLPDAIRPTIRTYTHRGIDLTANELWIDFVAHGEASPASAWAIQCQKGDCLGILMRDGKSSLYQPATQYVLVGDATAIPVLGAILEDLPAGVQVSCLIEVHGPDDEQSLPTKADARFIWLHNPTPQVSSPLADALRQLDLPQHDRFAYVAAEYATVKAIRQYLRTDQGWKSSELHAYSYWKKGVAEDQSAGERHRESET